MSAYAFPIKLALITFPILAFFISLPLFIMQYRKYGTFIFFRGVILYSFVFYLLCSYYLVILPLPPRSEVAHYTSQIIELRPFYSVVRFLNDTVLQLNKPSTYLPALTQGVVLEPVFNILLVVPFGIYLRYYFKLSFKKTLLASFLLTLFFELTQLSGLYFYYPRPYRLADVNDLMNNTLGGIIGYWITPLFSKLLPSRQALDDISYKLGHTVTLTRRFIALVIDWIVIDIILFIIQLILNITVSTTYGDKFSTLMSTTLTGTCLKIIIYFILFQFLAKGQTIGKKIVKIKLVSLRNKPLSIFQLIIRYGYLYGIPILCSAYFGYFAKIFSSESSITIPKNSLYIYVGILLSCLALGGIWFIVLAYNILKKQRRLYYEDASRTTCISTIKAKK